jgi:hypothetical protein
MVQLSIEEWLAKNSASNKRVGNELLFTHATGHTSTLILRSNRIEDELNPSSSALQAFYEQFLGAAIGDGQLIVGTPVRGGVRISQDFLIPDLNQMQSQAKVLGMPIVEMQEVFMVEACWMFLYAIERTDTEEILLEYDRDFGETERVRSIQTMLDSWWQMVQAEPKDPTEHQTRNRGGPGGATDEASPRR